MWVLLLAPSILLLLWVKCDADSCRTKSPLDDMATWPIASIAARTGQARLC